MKKKSIIIIAFLFFLISCKTFHTISKEKELFQTGGMNETIQNAILDFSETTKLYKKDSIFSVSFYDTIYNKVLGKSKDGIDKWVNGNAYNGIVAVNVIANKNQFLINADTKIGSKGKLPSKYIVKEGKLFYWWDDNCSLTDDALAILHKYNLLQDDQNGLIQFPDFVIDDAQKGVDYYFCRKNLNNYKKVVTNIGLGYYDVPSLKCNQ